MSAHEGGTSTRAPTVAVIGSFRRHLSSVNDACGAFRAAGLRVTSPLDDSVLEKGIEFVRFPSDDAAADDAMVQTIALGRILFADAVFVVAPEGYVGRTTCYEIGRVVQADRPLYFDTHPLDLPIRVSDSHVVPATTVASLILDSKAVPLSTDPDDEYNQLERGLLRVR